MHIMLLLQIYALKLLDFLKWIELQHITLTIKMLCGHKSFVIPKNISYLVAMLNPHDSLSRFNR